MCNNLRTFCQCWGKKICRSGKLLVIYYSYVELRIYCKTNTFMFFFIYHLKDFIHLYFKTINIPAHLAKEEITLFFILWHIQFVATFSKNYNPQASERSVIFTSLQSPYLCKLLVGLTQPRKKFSSVEVYKPELKFLYQYLTCTVHECN